MDLIPLIHMRNRKIHLGKRKSFVTPKEFLKLIEEENKLYILDLDGIEKDKPNLCTFQRLSGSHELWVDFGPRNLGDIVDATMAGATDITLRRNLSPQLYVPEIKEICENKIYLNIDFKEDLSIKGADGLVNFYTIKEIGSSFKFGSLFKEKTMKIRLYSYETELKNLTYWKNLGVTGLFVDLDKIKEFKNAL